MKTNARAWQAYQARVWAGLALLLILALGVFGKVFRFDRDCSPSLNGTTFAPGLHEPADCLAAR
ncbi:MAG TPA: hypothetical protein VL361_16925 [Candidatus Limnocylindrales bacterium]|jgi:hypothetical protein|nr:hypothetical protein [Candidatus Limnocylindrales bacterium]